MFADQKLNLTLEENGPLDKEVAKPNGSTTESNTLNENSIFASIKNPFTYLMKFGRELYIGLVFFFLYSGICCLS